MSNAAVQPAPSNGEVATPTSNSTPAQSWADSPGFEQNSVIRAFPCHRANCPISGRKMKAYRDPEPRKGSPGEDMVCWGLRQQPMKPNHATHRTRPRRDANTEGERGRGRAGVWPSAVRQAEDGAGAS